MAHSLCKRIINTCPQTPLPSRLLHSLPVFSLVLLFFYFCFLFHKPVFSEWMITMHGKIKQLRKHINAKRYNERPVNGVEKLDNFPKSVIMSDRPPVTCHILDTTTGKPAANVNCAIYKLSIADGVSLDGGEIYTEVDHPEPFAMASTNADGRIPTWIFDPNPSKRELLKDLGITKTKDNVLQWETLVYGTYKIRFQVGKYYQSTGQTNFHPFVEIIFKVEDSRHYHIPLLLSNYGYTTYRGS